MGQGTDVTKVPQEKLAGIIRQSRGALKRVQDGEVERAIALPRGGWACLPGAKPSRMHMTEARALFDRHLTGFISP